MSLAALKKDYKLIAFGFLLTFWSSPGQTFFISLFNEYLQTTHGLSHAGFGALYSLATVASAALMLWTGGLIDRIKLPVIVATTVCLLAASLLLLAKASHLLLLFLALLLVRQLGQGLMMLIASSTIVKYIDAARGKANALSGMGYITAEASLPALTVLLIGLLGWQGALSATAFFLAVILLPLTLLLLRGHTARHRAYVNTLQLQQNGNTDASPSVAKNTGVKTTTDEGINQRQWQRKEVIKDRAFYYFLPYMLAHPMLFTGFIFHQLYIADSKGWAIELWTQLFAVYALSGLVSKLATGIGVDRYSAAAFLPYSLLPLLVALLSLGLSANIAAAVIFFIALGMTTGMQTTLGAPFWVEIYGSLHIASIKSVTTFAVVISTAVTPVLFGWLIDVSISIEAIALGAVCYTLLSMVLAAQGRRLITQRSQREQNHARRDTHS